MKHTTVKSIKNRWVALMLAIFLGFFGTHRFYVGKAFTGFLYMFTGGLLFVGYVTDIIQIITGSFTDKSGAFLR